VRKARRARPTRSRFGSRRASARAVAAPIPRFAPVTRATRPVDVPRLLPRSARQRRRPPEDACGRNSRGDLQKAHRHQRASFAIESPPPPDEEFRRSGNGCQSRRECSRQYFREDRPLVWRLVEQSLDANGQLLLDYAPPASDLNLAEAQVSARTRFIDFAVGELVGLRPSL
jgi:hypothetical protein